MAPQGNRTTPPAPPPLHEHGPKTTAPWACRAETRSCLGIAPNTTQQSPPPPPIKAWCVLCAAWGTPGGGGRRTYAAMGSGLGPFLPVALQIVFKRDIFSLGVMLYALLCGRLPFQSTNFRELRREMATPLSFRGGEGLSAEAKSFVAALCTLKPFERPGSGAALAHPWLTARVAEDEAPGQVAHKYWGRGKREQAQGIGHDRPFMRVKVRERENGDVVAEQMRLSGYRIHDESDDDDSGSDIDD